MEHNARSRFFLLLGSLCLIPAGAPADEYRAPRPEPAELTVREWSTPYTLDIPANLSAGQRSAPPLTYAPAYGTPYPGQAGGQICPPGQINVQGYGCAVLVQPGANLPQGSLYRRR